MVLKFAQIHIPNNQYARISNVNLRSLFPESDPVGPCLPILPSFFLPFGKEPFYL